MLRIDAASASASGSTGTFTTMNDIPSFSIFGNDKSNSGTPIEEVDGDGGGTTSTVI